MFTKIQDFPGMLNFYHITVIQFFKSNWAEIRASAAMFIGKNFFFFSSVFSIANIYASLNSCFNFNIAIQYLKKKIVLFCNCVFVNF